MQIASKETNSGLGLKNFLYSPVKPFSIFWFLYVYFWIFVIHFLLALMLARKSNEAILIVSIILFLFNPLLPNFWILKNLATYMLYYSIGLFTLSFVKKYRRMFNLPGIILVWLVLFLAAFFVYFICMKQSLTVATYYLGFLTSILGSILFINISLNVSKNSIFGKMNDYFGVYSMQIYVVHLLPLAFFRIILIKFLHFQNLWVISILITIIAMIVCVIVIQLSKRLNLMKVLF